MELDTFRLTPQSAEKGNKGTELWRPTSIISIPRGGERRVNRGAFRFGAYKSRRRPWLGVPRDLGYLHPRRV
jgi:hypothetical protein